MSSEEFIIPELLPAYEDGVFKSLLTHPDAKPVLRDVISSILRISVIDVEVKNVELPISDIGEKRERLDVNCTADGEKQVNVEMQSVTMKGDSAASGHINIKSRAIFNLCYLHASQEGRGVSYRKLLGSFQITFCDYTVFPEREDFISRFSFRDENGWELLGTVGIIFVELTKFGKAMKKSASEMTPIEMWGIFFGHADDPKCRKLLNEMISAKEEIKMASELLANISSDPVQRAHFLSRRKFQMDMDHDRAETLEEGIAKGMAEGMAKGMAEGMVNGITQKSIEIAKNLLGKNMQIDEISEVTGLTPAEIEKLRS